MIPDRMLSLEIWKSFTLQYQCRSLLVCGLIFPDWAGQGTPTEKASLRDRAPMSPGEPGFRRGLAFSWVHGSQLDELPRLTGKTQEEFSLGALFLVTTVLPDQAPSSQLICLCQPRTISHGKGPEARNAEHHLTHEAHGGAADLPVFSVVRQRTEGASSKGWAKSLSAS